MQDHDSVDRPPQAAREEVVRTRRIEVVDDEGAPRILVGRLGEGDGSVFGVSVHAGDPSTGIHMTADARSAGVTVSRRGDQVVDCRVFGGDGEPIAALDIGTSTSLVSIEVAAGGAVTVRLGGARVVP